MSIEEKVKAYKELRRKIDELEEQKKALVAEILQLMPKESKALRIAEYTVRRMVRLSIRTSLENARLLGAVRVEEVVDRERIKQLYAQGQPVPDVVEIQYINVSQAIQQEPVTIG